MRVTSQLLINNFLSDLQKVQQDLARYQRMAATGRAFERPRENPSGTAKSLDLHSAINYLGQYTRNAEDGSSRLSYTETSITDVNQTLQRVRELTVQGANTYLTRNDRIAISQEMNQLLEQVVTLSNSNFRGRYVFSGYETLTQSFDRRINTEDGYTNSVTYMGDTGGIGRNIGIRSALDVNFNGKDVFLKQTYTLNGKQLGAGALGFSGTFELNNRLFTVTSSMTLKEVADMINANGQTEALAQVTNDLRLKLVSLNSTHEIEARDISGRVLEFLGILPQGAFNMAQTGPTLPLTDSLGARHDSAALVFPLSLTPATQDFVVQLGGAANGGFTETHALKLDAITYATSADLVAEIQKKADLAFGTEKIKVNDLGGGVIEMETFVQSGAVTVADLQLGGTAPDGTVDTASTVLGFNAVASVPEVADFAGVDGNDRFTIDLGLSAYRSVHGAPPVDLPLIELNLDATSALTLASLVTNINDKLQANRYLAGLVEAVEDNGRLRLQTTKQGLEVLGSDLLLANAVTGPVVLATDTLGALGIYRDAATGVSAPPVPATVFSTAPFPPGIGAIGLGVNDQFSIDLGPNSSNDGTDPLAQTITLTPGGYPTAASLATEINNQISLNGTLKNAVLAVVRTVGLTDFVDIVTAKSGSRVQDTDLILADVVPGTLANLGLGAPTTPGGGSSDGQGDITEPDNIINTMIQIRDELIGTAAPASLLTDLTDKDGQPLGLFPGGKIRISSDGSFTEFYVQRFTTMKELAQRIEAKLGFQLDVTVLRDGRIELFNPTTTTVNDILVEAFDAAGNSVPAFNKAMEGLSGDLTFRGRFQSDTVYEDERFQNLTNRIGDVDTSLETILATLGELGSRAKRLELTTAQNDVVSGNLQELQSTVDNADMAEVITKLKETENVLQAALGTGARVLTQTLFDFLR